MKKKKVDPEDLNNTDVLLAAIKKMEEKLSLAAEMPVELPEEMDFMFAPWTRATRELDLVCGEMFDINVDEQ